MEDTAIQYAPVIWVTLIYILLYYAFQIHGLRVKLKIIKRCKAEGKPFNRYDQTYPELLASDRVQLNTLEHMPPFLILLWMQAVVCSPQSASVLGGAYVLLRASYPFFMGPKLTNYVPKRLFINTFAGYAVLMAMSAFIIQAIL